MDEPPYPDDGYATSGPASAPVPVASIRPEPTTVPQVREPSSLSPAVVEPVITSPRATESRSFDGPPVAPRPRLTAGLSARQSEVPGPAISRPVSETPLHPGSTTDTFESKAIREPEPQPVAAAPAAPAAAAPVAAPPRPAVQPVTESAPAWGAPSESEEQPEARTAIAGARLSRYQQLMSQSKDSAPSTQQTSSDNAWGAPDRVVRAAPAEPEDFSPSEDDIEVEDSALIGVPAVERLLGGLVIEQRDVNGNIVEMKRGL